MRRSQGSERVGDTVGGAPSPIRQESRTRDKDSECVSLDYIAERFGSSAEGRRRTRVIRLTGCGEHARVFSTVAARMRAGVRPCVRAYVRKCAPDRSQNHKRVSPSRRRGLGWARFSRRSRCQEKIESEIELNALSRSAKENICIRVCVFLEKN